MLSKIANKIEHILIANWFNPILTFWFNFRFLDFRQALKFPFFIYGHPRIQGGGKIIIEGPIKKGMITINKVYKWAPSNMTSQTMFLNSGIIKVLGKGHIGTGTKIAVHPNAKLEIGQDFQIQDEVNIGCMNSISLGNYISITHRCQIFDSNYHFLLNVNTGVIQDYKSSIEISDMCWIGNSSTINGSVKLPLCTTVCSHSLVNKSTNEIPPFSIIGGVPAHIIKTGFRRIYDSNIEEDIIKYFAENNGDSYRYDNNCDLRTTNLL